MKSQLSTFELAENVNKTYSILFYVKVVIIYIYNDIIISWAKRLFGSLAVLQPDACSTNLFSFEVQVPVFRHIGRNAVTIQVALHIVPLVKLYNVTTVGLSFKLRSSLDVVKLNLSEPRIWHHYDIAVVCCQEPEFNYLVSLWCKTSQLLPWNYGGWILGSPADLCPVAWLFVLCDTQLVHVDKSLNNSLTSLYKKDG